MATSITEKILSSNKLYTDKYFKDTLKLTKSIVIHNSKEARLYNEYIEANYPSHLVLVDKTTWRYYKHLSAQYHELDTPISITSIDNGLPIDLTPTSLLLHRLTHKELLTFGLLYKELVDNYPEQELYIRAVIATSPRYSIQEITAFEDYQIVSYNASFVEENENDLIFLLQKRIDNYKNSKLIPYYALADNLFIASQYHILYTYIFKTLIGIRLSKAKTLGAHSYHILNYLSSHHYLDLHYDNLTKKQSLYLYRNLLYLDNHSGQEITFQTLIDKLFTDRNISVVTYEYNKENKLDTQDYTKYRYNQKLLNNANLVYSLKDYSVEELLDKESSTAQDNVKYIKYNTIDTDFAYKNMLYNNFLTKDIETIVVDNTDTVEYKLMPTIIDYWAYLLKTNRMMYLVTVVDPVSNISLRLNTTDLFKLYVATLYRMNSIEITNFPNYRIDRVYKDTLPSKATLLNYFFNKRHYHKAWIDDILHSVPNYSSVITSYQFEQFITAIYKLNIGLWLFKSNLHDKNDTGQFENVISNLHKEDLYVFDDETVEEFLKRINLEDHATYSKDSLSDILYSVVNTLCDGKLGVFNKYRLIQQSLIEVFKKFNSYTVQVITNYSQYYPILAGPRAPNTTISFDSETNLYFLDSYVFNIEMLYAIRYYSEVGFKIDYFGAERYNVKCSVDLSSDLELHYALNSKAFIQFNTDVINDLEGTDWIVSDCSDEHKMFLAFN